MQTTRAGTRRTRHVHDAFRTTIESLERRLLFAAARTPAPALDRSFGGGDGVVDSALPYNVALSGAAPTADGKFIVCGYTRQYTVSLGPPTRDYFVARVN